MTGGFGYVNARVRGLRSRLLPAGFVAEQIDADGFAALSSALAQTPYGRDLEEESASRGPLAAVDAALARNFVRSTQLLLSSARGPARDLIALLLRRYDLANLKAVVRGLHAGRSPDEVMEAVLPAGELGGASLRSMAAAGDLPAAGQLLSLLRHPLAEAFRRAAAGYGDDGDLLAFEVALDRAFFERLAADARRARAAAGFRRLVAAELDATNLLTAWKLRGRAVDPERFFVPGGSELTRAAFDRIVALPRTEALPSLDGLPSGLAGATTLSELEAQLAAAHDLLARRLALDPLGVGLVADYLRRKERETARLRLLARGKFYGVPRAALAGELGDA